MCICARLPFCGCGHDNSGKICQAFRSKDGLEGWVQVELAIRFSSCLRTLSDIRDPDREEPFNLHDPGYLVALREQPIYKKKADLLLWHPRSTKIEETLDSYSEIPMTYPVIIIELKCESFGNMKRFEDNVKADLKKMNDADPVYRPCWMYCVGLSITRFGHEVMERLGMECEEVPNEMNYPLRVF
jgi:hypothetical protein